MCDDLDQKRERDLWQELKQWHNIRCKDGEQSDRSKGKEDQAGSGYREKEASRVLL